MSVKSMMAEKRLRKYRNQFRNNGWELRVQENGQIQNVDNLNGPSFYLCDYESGHLHVVATRGNVFELVEEYKRQTGATFQDMCDALGSLYTDICTGKIMLSVEVTDMLNKSAYI